MARKFPLAPSVNEQVQLGSKTFSWDGSFWKRDQVTAAEVTSEAVAAEEAAKAYADTTTVAKSGDTMTGNLIMSSGSISLVSGDVVLAQDPTNPSHAASKNYVDNSHVDNNIAITTLNSQVSSIESGIANFKHVFVSDTTPTVDGNDSGEFLQEGDVWYDRSNGHVYIYVNTLDSEFSWVEQGGSADYANDAYGINNNDFPATPTDGDIHKGYMYDSARAVWNIIEKTTTVSDNTDVAVDTPLADQVLMYNSATGLFENVNGVRLDEVGQIPLTFLNTVKDAIEGGTVDQGYQTLLEVQNSVATEITNLLDSATAPFDTLGKIQTYVNASLALSEDVSKLTVMSAAEWASDVSVLESGSLNAETGGATVKLKIGDGLSTFSELEYIPTNDYIDSTVAAAIAGKANKANPTFTGTASLPSTTSIGDVDATEISYLNGVTSAVQTQIDDLDAAKADKADPTFTGTVSGIDKTMVGLGNVNNTADANKPVSNSTQTALDLKADLAAANFVGNVEVGGSLVVDGDFTVNGANFVNSATSITIEDNIVLLASGNAGNVVDLGLVVLYNDGVEKRSGLVRDVSDDTWKLFDGVTSAAGTTVAFAEGSLDNLAVNNITAAGVVFTDGSVQAKAGVPSISTFTEKVASYTLDTLDHIDGIIEMNSATAETFTIPTDAALAWPIGASLDVFASSTGVITIAGDTGVTVNATPGLILRTQWSSATLLKRGADTWVVYGDLKA